MMLLGPRRADAPGAGQRLGWLAAGGIAGSLPALALMASAWNSFIFGNLGYPQLNTAWYASQGVTKAMDVAGKLTYLFQDVVTDPPNLALGLVFVFALLGRNLLREGVRGGPGLPVAAGLLCLPFAAFGAFAPSPSWPQYYASCVPFLVLIAVYGVAHVARDAQHARPALGLLALAAAVAAGYGYDAYRGVRGLSQPETWAPMEVHRVGERIGEIVDGGLVLTEAPIFALEGEASIYPFNATGPFAWRTGHMLTDEERAELGIMIPKNLPTILRETPPDAVLTGSDGWMNKPTRQYARIEGMEAVALENDFLLIVKPG
jgi:hypothetical protein